MLSILIATTMVAAHPQTIVVPTYPKSYCQNPQTQEGMNFCSGRAYVAADVIMTRRYNVLAVQMKRMDGQESGYFASLLESQRTWLKFRDAQCLLEGYRTRGGTAEAMNINGCMEQMTKRRTEELESLSEAFGR